ncbi:MAG: hypothetical protein JJ891_12725 [Rhizobiaceae bacterium]|nr:hypothetical protein [Rhizobiaceae bacterium]
MGKLNHLRKKTLSRYEKCTDEAFPGAVEWDFPKTDQFIALAEPHPDDNGKGGVRVVISSGVVDRLTDAWNAAMEYSGQSSDPHFLNVGDVDEAIEYSMQWLMLHELHHFQMGHFKLKGGMGLVETYQSAAFALAMRSDNDASSLIEMLPLEERKPAERCLELQADHDTIDMMLDGYSNTNWPELRFLAACNFMIMILIEQEERLTKDDPNRTHPKAATRIFQLLGHLASMYLIPAKIKAQEKGLDRPDPNNLPPESEIIAFQSEVVYPAFADAALIAKANGADAIVQELGDFTDLIADIGALQLPNDNPILKTEGAIEYAELEALNFKLMQMLDLPRYV